MRLYALYTEGGIYLDSDVEIYKSFDEFLKYSFFTGTDIRSPQLNYYGIEAAIIGAEKGHPYLKKCMEFYGQLQFIRADGSMNITVMPDNITPLLETYGYKPIDGTQYLSHNMVVFSSAYFANCNALSYSNVYARHWNTNTWRLTDRGKIFHFCYTHDLMFIYRFVERIFIIFRK